MGVKHPLGMGILHLLWPSTHRVSSPQDATSQMLLSLSAGKMAMNKINEALNDGSSWWCLQWGISQHLSTATLRSSFYCPKMLFLSCRRPLTGHSGTGSPELPHYSTLSVLHPRLQYIIIQMSQPQWKTKYARWFLSNALSPALPNYSQQLIGTVEHGGWWGSRGVLI